MVVGVKDAAKLVGIAIVACCAVLVCTMFLNFYFDVRLIADQITSEPARIFYNAQVSTAKVVCLVSGGCLLATSVVLLLFYVKHYIDAHKTQLGILKALGYADSEIAKHFWVFGLTVLGGAVIGFAGAFLLMPEFYRLQNEESILPEISMRFHPGVLVYFVLAPAAAFAALSVCYAWVMLKKPVLSLLNERVSEPAPAKAHRAGEAADDPFLTDLRKRTIRDRKILAFFIFFASFCFSAMTQMSFSMKDLSSEMMGLMTLLIGLVLAFTALILAITTVVSGNRKTIAMMRVFGYSQEECSRAILSGYRPVAYIGFATGTIYQYALLRVMVDVVFRDVAGVPVYRFDFPMMFVSLAVFLVLYALLMRVYSERIKRISVKEIMLN